MAARKLYPAPECPKCGKTTSRVKNTYYTKDGRIARTRECELCQWSWWSVQYPEHNLDPAKWRLSIPKFTAGPNRAKQIEILPWDA